MKAINYPKSGTHFHAYLSFKKQAEGRGASRADAAG